MKTKEAKFSGKFDVLCFLETPVLRFAPLSYYRRYAIRKPPSAKALSSFSKITSFLIDHSLFSISNFSIKIFAEHFSLFRISFVSFIISIIDKLLGIKDFFSSVLFSKLLASFIRGSRVHDSEALSLFLIDVGVVKRMNIKFKLGNWFKRVHEDPYLEANISLFCFSLNVGARFYNILQQYFVGECIIPDKFSGAFFCEFHCNWLWFRA